MRSASGKPGRAKVMAEAAIEDIAAGHDVEREPRLPDPARSHEGYQPMGRQQLGDAGDFLLAAHERGEQERQVVSQHAERSQCGELRRQAGRA